MKMSLLLTLSLLSANAVAQELSIKTIETEKEMSAPFDPKKIGEVISVAKDVVALGEQVYTLIQKGKPGIVTEYAPISVVPKDSSTKEIVDPFDMEDCALPVERKFSTTIKRGTAELVKFEYMIITTYGCSYNGKGKYIQSAMVQPLGVKAAYGWDVNANMKLQALMNHGKKDDPIVGATLTLKYTMNSWNTAYERNDTIHITGAGLVKAYSK
jgi:hypothetical protein